MSLEGYGLRWPANTRQLDVERYFIQRGGSYVHGGVTYGLGLFHHYRAMQTLLWPEDDHHRWSDLILEHICKENLVVVMGARDSGKTHTFSKYTLCDYFCFPNETLFLVSSTGVRELETRVWGDMKDLYARARDRYPDLPGNVVDGKHGIFTDALDETSDVRDMRRGTLCVPCLGGQGEWVGLEKYVGIKQKRRRLIGDELQFMDPVYLNVLDALDKGDFKAGFSGNPIGGNGKALDKVAEPVKGWSSLGEVTKTTVWRNRYGGVTINLVGIDSPNFDKDAPKKYPYLIDQSDVDKVVARNGKDSAQFWTFIMGVRKTGVDMFRVWTVELCERCGAFEKATWSGSPRTKVYGIDAGFGGDPCQAMYLEFGEDVNGQIVVKFHPPTLIPVAVSSDLTPEKQIALFAKADCTLLGVPDEGVFFEAGMRATLAIEMAKVFSPRVNAVNFGGPATDRPVSADMLVFDEATQERRPKRCSEHYSKFVTELWYSIRELIEGEQAREFPRDVADEGALRDFRYVPGGKFGERIELETKPEYKHRNGSSPNKADATATALEGARRLGLVLSRVPDPNAPPPVNDDWLEREINLERQKIKKLELRYT